MSEQMDDSVLIGPTDVDDRSGERCLKIEVPVPRQRSTWGSSIDTRRGALPGCDDESPGASGQSPEIRVMKSMPDFLLPAGVVVLDGGLEPGLSRWGEDGGDAKLQTEANDASERVLTAVVALEEGVVVELGVVREAVLGPMRDERFDREFRGPGGSDPTGAESSLKTECIENHHIRAAFDDESLDEVEAVELGSGGCDGREIPAFGRGWPSDSLATVQSATSKQDATDSSQGRNASFAARFESSVDGGGSEFSEVTGFLEFLAKSEDPVLDARRGGETRPSTTARRIGPVDAIESLTVRSPHPVLDGRETHLEFPLDISQGSTSPHGQNHAAPPLFNPVFRSRSVLPTKRFSARW